MLAGLCFVLFTKATFAQADQKEFLPTLGNAGNLIQKGLQMHKQHQEDSAVFYLRQAIRLSKQMNDTLNLFKSYYSISLPFYRKGNRITSRMYADSAQFLSGKIEGEEEIKISLRINQIVAVWSVVSGKETRSALFALLRSFDTAEFYRWQASIYNMLSKSYIDDYEFPHHKDSAMLFAKYSVQKSLLAKDSNTIAKTKNTYGTMLVFVDSAYERGIAELLEALLIFNEIGSPYMSASVGMQLSKSYYQNQDYFKAIQFADTAFQKGFSHNYLEVMYQARSLQAFSYEKLKNYEKAYQSLKLAGDLKDSLHGQKVKEKLADLEVSYQTWEKENQIKLLEAEKLLEEKKRQELMILLAAFVIIATVSTVWLVQRHRLKQRLAIQKQEQLKLKIAHQESEQKRLKEQLEMKSRQLFTQAMSLAERNELLHSLLDKINTVNGSDDKTLMRIGQLLKQNLYSESPWEEFKKGFIEVHPSFFQKLDALNLHITEKEKRHLAFAKIGLSIKEIAALLHIEPNSVKVARYRLKKKFNLPDEESLEQYVSRL